MARSPHAGVAKKRLTLERKTIKYATAGFAVYLLVVTSIGIF